MRAAGADVTQDSTAGDHSPAVASSPRGNSRTTDASAATAAGVGIRNTDEPDIELIYSGESDDASDSKPAPSAFGSPQVDTNRDRLARSEKR